MNLAKLDAYIESSGYKLEFIAKKIGLSRQGFHLKRVGQTEFNVSEINILCQLLGIDSPEERNDVFFNQSVDN